MSHHEYCLSAILYALSHRDDTEYWRDIQNRDYPEDIFSHNTEGISRSFNQAYVAKNFVEQFDNSILHCMSVGMNWNPIDIHSIKYKMGNIETIKKNTESLIQQMETRKKRWNEQVKDFPSPYQYLKDYVYKK